MQKIKTETQVVLMLMQKERQLAKKQKEDIHTFITESRSEMEGEDKEYLASEEKIDSEAETSRCVKQRRKNRNSQKVYRRGS